jgi:hypothetical protein
MWDLPTAPDRPQLSRLEGTTGLVPPVANVHRDRTESMRTTTAPNVGAFPSLTSRAPPIHMQTQHSAQVAGIPQNSNAVHPSGGCWSHQPQTISSQPYADPRFAFHMANPLVTPFPSFPSILPAVVPPAMYSLYTPPAVAPTSTPSNYGAWGYSSLFGMPQLAYQPPGFSQPPHFAHASSYSLQPSSVYTTPLVDQEVVSLQRQLDALRKREQQSDDDKEFAKVHDLLTGLQVSCHLCVNRNERIVSLNF